MSHAPVILYKNVITQVNVTASDADPGYPASAAASPFTYEWWQFTGGSTTLDIDCGVVVPVNAMGILALGLMGNVVISSSADGITFTARGSQTINKDGVVMTLLPSVVVARYWRVTITATGAGVGGTVRIPVIYLGETLQFERCTRGSYTPVVMGRQTDYTDNVSGNGQFLGRSIVRNNLSSQYNIERMTSQWNRQFFQPFVESARELPYFFSWWHEKYPQEAVFVRTDEDITTKYTGDRNFMSAQWTMRSAGIAAAGTVVDKTQLQNAIEAASALYEPWFDADTWQDMQDALAAAINVYNNNSAAYQDVIAATNDLFDALSNLSRDDGLCGTTIYPINYNHQDKSAATLQGNSISGSGYAFSTFGYPNELEIPDPSFNRIIGLKRTSNNSLSSAAIEVFDPNSNMVGSVSMYRGLSGGEIRWSMGSISGTEPYINNVYVSINSSGTVSFIADNIIVATSDSAYNDGVYFGFRCNAEAPATILMDSSELEVYEGEGDIDSSYKDWCGNDLLTGECPMPLDSDLVPALPGGIGVPFIISGDESQTVSTGTPTAGYYITNSNSAPFDIDWGANEIRWVGAIDFNYASANTIGIGVIRSTDFSTVGVTVAYNSFTDEYSVIVASATMGVITQQGDKTYDDSPTFIGIGIGGDGLIYLCVDGDVSQMQTGSGDPITIPSAFDGWSVAASLDNTSGAFTTELHTTIVTSAGAMPEPFTQIAGNPAYKDLCGNDIQSV